MQRPMEEYPYDFFNSKMRCDSQFAKTYISQVMSICLNPNLLQTKNLILMPEAIKKASKYIKSTKLGAYSCAKGIESIRKNIAAHISERDNLKVAEDDIFLLYGGMDAYQHIIGLFNNNEKVNYIKFNF